MKTFEKISTLAIGLALITGLLSCKPEVEYIEKPVEKEYAKAVTFESTASEGKVTVTLKTETEDAVIYYTIDGKTIPSTESTKYTEALSFTEDAVVMAIAVKEGIENSPLSYAKVSITEKKIVEEKVVEKEVEKEVEKLVDKKADETAPANVTNLAAVAKDARVLLTWTDAADTDVYGYEVTYSGTNAINRVVFPALDSKSMMAPKGAGGCYVSGLTNGTEYTFTVKTVDTSGNKSAGVSATSTPVAPAAGEALQIALSASVPNTNKLGEAYTGTKSNTKVTVTASITSASSVKKVVWKKNGSLIAKTLLADSEASAATVTSDNAVWTFDITATDETANGTYTVAAIDNAGREEAEQITIDQFDFTPPSKVTGVSGNYQNSQITLSWIDPADADYDHVAITYTYNDGTSDSQPSQAVNVAKDTLTKTFENILGTAKYYTFSLISVDSLGNTSTVKSWKVSVTEQVNNCPEGFVEVSGASVEGDVSGSYVFITNRTVTIGNLYVSAAEVTQKEYETYCKYGSSIPDTSYGKGDNYPAYYVSWYDAIVYCNLRTIAELSENDCVYSINGEKDPRKWEGVVGNAETKFCGPRDETSSWDFNGTDDTDGGIICDITKEGYRLPTEVEWEYIARGGNNGIPETQTTYSGSNTIDDVAWYRGNSGNKTHEVKTDKVENTDSANALGIYDMSGNVWEWCWDWYNSIDSSTPDLGSASGSNRVGRGGSWCNSADDCTVSIQNYFYPSYRIYALGFRVVRTAK